MAVDFYFDFASPYGFIAAMQIDAIRPPIANIGWRAAPPAMLLLPLTPLPRSASIEMQFWRACKTPAQSPV